VAIIMDGSGRWAAQRGLPRLKGHEQGIEAVRETLKGCRDLGIRYLTLYAFSVENWSRPAAEIAGLMNLLALFLRREERLLHEHRIRLRTIGRTTDLPPAVREELERVCRETAAYDTPQLILALSYGGRTEIAHAARELARRVERGELRADDINEAAVARHLYAPDVPDPDLLIRTSGELRLSNFLLWQLSYTEIYVTDVLWPDFRKGDLVKAVEDYGRRQRRFGGIAPPRAGA
jgi:undecaprenyl diphosphate synthase